MSNVQAKGEAPKYRLEEVAYIGDVMYEKEAVIEWHGIPGWHMEPVNEAAKAMKAKHPSSRPSPIDEMTNLNSSVAETSVGQLVEVLAKALQQSQAKA